MPVELTILNSMAGRDFEAALDRHAAWNLKQLDLKEAVYGKKITELSEAEAERAQRAIAARGLRVYCFSTTLFAGAVEEGEGAFREQHLGPLKATLAAARILRPKLIRLIDAKPAEKPAGADALDYLRSRHAWIFECYAEAVDAIAEAGFQTTIENEPGGFLDSPAAIARFFDGLGRRERVNYTWDAQNLWQSGIEPSLEVYARLKPVLAYYHVKGGRVVNGRMKATALSDAGWPVIEITRRVVAEGLSPVICLNPPHGERDGGFDLDDLTARDLAFLRREVEGIAP
ncbi:MAG: TIM barrel protein [Planctomycetota bacterium]|nr:TIM barrel protein [Planctomycetota bacterium]